MVEPAAKPSGPFQQPINPEAARLAQQPPKEPVRVEGTRATPATNLYDGSPQERWAADQAAADARDPQRNPNIVLVKDAAGNLVAHEKIIGANGEATIGKAIDQPDGDNKAPAGKTEAGDDTMFRFGDLELSGKQIHELVAHKAADDLRRTTIPATPAGYKMVLPENLVLPEGVSFTIAENDPTRAADFQALREYAHQNSWSQDQVSGVLGLYAAAESQRSIALSKAANVERQKLGVSGPARVDAVALFLKGQFGDTAAKAFIATLVTEAQVKAWESVITRYTNGGGGSYSQRGRDMDSPTISDEQWNKMSYHQQVEYARDATARAASGGRR